MLNLSVKNKPPLSSLPETLKAIKRGEEQLADSGYVLVRYSGTEPLLRVTVQGPKKKLVNEIAQQIANAAQAEIG